MGSLPLVLTQEYEGLCVSLHPPCRCLRCWPPPCRRLCPSCWPSVPSVRLQAIPGRLTSHCELGTGGTADVFSGAHPWFLRVVVSWPQHHGDLGPEIWESCHAHIRVISSRAYFSEENLNLSGDRVLAGEVGSYGGDHSGAVRAGVGRGDGKKGGESNNEFHDDFLTSLNKSPC